MIERSELAALTCGRDLYSNLEMHELVSRVSTRDVQAVADGLASSSDRAAALRWICRGLDAAIAVEKVRVDLTVRSYMNFVHKARRRRPRIEQINETPLDAIKDEELTGLLVGRRDLFSSMSGVALRKRVANEMIVARVETALADPRDHDRALRWWLRGLEVERAIRKALADACPRSGG